METNLNRVATDLIDKISNFSNLEYKDRENQTIPPTMDDQIENARIFNFNFDENGVDFGPVTITISEQDGLQIKTYSDPVEGKRDKEQDIWYDFIKSMSEFATEHVILFKGHKIVTKKIMPKTEVGESKMTESKLVGTSKTSYQDLGEATLIVKHTRPINYNAANGRTQHIESIFIENAAGERFRYPYKHLNGARALAEHIKAGGHPYDDVGQYMIGLSEELNKLRMFKGYVTRSPMVSEAMGAVTNKVFERIEGIKKEIHSLQSKKYYAEWVEGFNKVESKEIPEDIRNEWIDRLTIKTFNEELTSVFPYLFNIIEESDLPIKNISAEDILDSIQQVQEFNEPNREIQELIDLENFVDNIVKEDTDTGIFSDDPTAVETAITKLNELVVENPDAMVGLSGENGKKLIATIFNSNELMKEIEDRAEQSEGSNTPLWPLIQAYLEFKSPEMLKDNGGEIDFNPEPAAAPPETAPEPAPVAEPAPAAAPVEPQPQQEGWQSGLEQRLGKIKSLAEQSGRDFDSINLNINGKSYSLSEALSAFNLIEKTKEDPPFDPDPPKKNPSAVAGKYGQGYSTARHLAKQGQAQAEKKSLAKQIQEMVKSFTNLIPERMDQGPFPLGEEGVVTKVTKDMCEKFGKEEDQRFKMAVETYCRETVGKFSSVYETYRMKKLAGMDAEMGEGYYKDPDGDDESAEDREDKKDNERRRRQEEDEMEEGSIQNGVWVSSPDKGVPPPSPNEGPTSNVRPVKPGTTPEQAKLDPRYKTDPNFKREVDAAMQITSGPNTGKAWSPSTPGPTNPNFKPNINGIPQNPDGGSAPPPGYKPAREEIARIRELAGLR